MIVRALSAAVFFMGVLFLHLDVTNAQLVHAEWGTIGLTAIAPLLFHAVVAVFAAVMWWRALEPRRAPQPSRQLSAAHGAV